MPASEKSNPILEDNVNAASTINVTPQRTCFCAAGELRVQISALRFIQRRVDVRSVSGVVVWATMSAKASTYRSGLTGKIGLRSRGGVVHGIVRQGVRFVRERARNV